MKQATKQQRERWERDNRAAANVILGAPEKHPAFMRQWATRFMQRRTEETTGQRPLFATTGVQYCIN